MALLAFTEWILGILTSVNLATALTAISVLILHWYMTIPKGIPPGPFVLPFVGYLQCMGREPHLKFSKLAKKYGPVFRLYMGNRLVVVLNNYESIKEAFINQAETFVGRPEMQLSTFETDQYNFLLHDKEVWKAHRRFALNVLRDCGVGKMSIEPQIMKEIQIFLTELKKLNGKPSDFSEFIALSVANNICIPIYGQRFEYDDPWFLMAKQQVFEEMSEQNVVSIFNFFPWVNKLPKINQILGRERLMQNRKNLKGTQYNRILERKSDHEDGQRDNYMNALITEQKSREKKNDQSGIFSDQALVDNVGLLFLAGSETTANTIMWCVVYMAAYPEVQKKVQMEIDGLIGTERTSCFSDRLRTPYTEATLLEVQRIATLVPMNIPHRNTKDCEVLGYKIPKDTVIFSNLWAVHNDASLWTDPEEFRPERFLSPEGEIARKEYLIPFSIGKRECPGKILAVMELYLYFTSMLQTFTFKTADGLKPNLERGTGFTVRPLYFNIRAVSRNAELVIEG